MHWSWVSFLIGLFIGGAVGLLAAGLCQAAHGNRPD